jgi:hypothetical protein
VLEECAVHQGVLAPLNVGGDESASFGTAKRHDHARLQGGVLGSSAEGGWQGCSTAEFGGRAAEDHRRRLASRCSTAQLTSRLCPC